MRRHAPRRRASVGQRTGVGGQSRQILYCPNRAYWRPMNGVVVQSGSPLVVSCVRCGHYLTILEVENGEFWPPRVFLAHRACVMSVIMIVSYSTTCNEFGGVVLAQSTRMWDARRQPARDPATGFKNKSSLFVLFLFGAR